MSYVINMQLFGRGWFISGHNESVDYERKDMKKKSHYALNDTDETVDVSLMKEEQKKLPKNIVFVWKKHDLLPQVIFHTVRQLIQERGSKWTKPQIFRHYTVVNMTRIKMR